MRGIPGMLGDLAHLFSVIFHFSIFFARAGVNRWVGLGVWILSLHVEANEALLFGVTSPMSVGRRVGAASHNLLACVIRQWAGPENWHKKQIIIFAVSYVFVVNDIFANPPSSLFNFRSRSQ
jgi:hypothetical protein